MQSNFQIKLTAVTPHFVFEYCPWHRKNDTPDPLEQKNKTYFFEIFICVRGMKWNHSVHVFSDLGKFQFLLSKVCWSLIFSLRSLVCVCLSQVNNRQVKRCPQYILLDYWQTSILVSDIITLAKHQNVVADSAITNYQFTSEYFIVIALFYQLYALQYSWQNH